MKRKPHKRSSRNTRIARRKKAERGGSSGRAARIVARVSALLCALFLIYFAAAKIRSVVSLPEIRLREIRFEGMGGLDRTELLKRANVTRDTNLLGLNLKEIRKGILTEPFVKDAEVRRNLYSGQLTIRLRLREAVALINCNGIHGIDADGVLLEEMRRMSSCDLPLINGVRAGKVKPGERIVSGDMDRAFRILEHVSSSHLESVVMLSEINVGDSRNAVLYVGRDGTQLRLGRDRFREKIDKAVPILADFQGKGKEVEYIDFRFEKRIIVKPKK
jgi:cell division protein FtsQ